MSTPAYDRAADDVGNVVALEHVNVCVPDQALATLFYVQGLGLTRDPYLMVGVDNMWINAGRQQFHLPTNRPQLVPGTIGLVLPSLARTAERLERVRERLAGTAFGFDLAADHLDVTCPWGNRIRCHAPAPEFGDMRLGMPYVEFPVAPGAAAGIARFYGEVLGARAAVKDGVARVAVGAHQHLSFRETEAPRRPYDGHHVAVYLANFSAPYRGLVERGLVTRETGAHEYRFQDIVDLASGRILFTVEHEVRSLGHPMYMRPLVNRNPAQTQRGYVPFGDPWFPSAE